MAEKEITKAKEEEAEEEYYRMLYDTSMYPSQIT